MHHFRENHMVDPTAAEARDQARGTAVIIIAGMIGFTLIVLTIAIAAGAVIDFFPRI
jgi:uncharacterized protein YybS (DUF2232 family)